MILSVAIKDKNGLELPIDIWQVFELRDYGGIGGKWILLF